MSTTENREKGLEGSTKSSLLVMSLTLASRLLGFARIAVITGFFGAGSKADIINLTFSIPNNLRKLLAEGALSSAFIPELSRSLVDDPSGKSSGVLVRRILGFQLLIILPLCILAIVFAEPLIAKVLSEFQNPAELAEATRLFRLFINYLLLISLSAVLMGVLNAHHKFFVSALAPVFFSLSVIAAIIFTSRGLGIYAVALGVLAGGILQVAVQTPLFKRLGYTMRPRFSLRDPAFSRVLRLWLPVVATSSLFTITYQVAIRFASGLGEGSVTSLAIAITFFQLPFGIFSASVTTVLFPRMSRQVAQNDVKGLRESLQYGLRFLAVLLIPSAVFLCIASEGLVAVAFQRGAFEPSRTAETAKVLGAYALGLFSVGAFTFIQRLFYAQNLHRIPFYVAAVVAIVDLVLMLLLKATSLATAGIALANSISFTVGALILFVLARVRLGPIGGRRLLLTGFKAFVAVAAATAIVYASRLLTGVWWKDGSSFASFALLLEEISLFSAVVLGSYKLMRVEMISNLFSWRKSHV